ncbi:ABC transporter substrate-binding protein [Streptosporangium sp. CA-135522]|uniref:ABC transporter substrate-binding protein n=1 Tax=Streptosporangium sp. CA-135522 TaxID=3240072 RepID=UPI003D93A941
MALFTRNLALTVGAAGLLMLAACGRDAGTAGPTISSDPGITDTTITIGTSQPLSGPLASAGEATLAASQAYFAHVNAQGGVKMGDGKTRTIKYVYYDDAYDPAKSVQNYQRLVHQDAVFAVFQPLGTGPNLAIMPRANADKVPHLYVHSGSEKFSDRAKNPWTVGWGPTPVSEGETYGKYLAARNKPMTVAVLRQNDDLGQGYLTGLQAGIKGSEVEIVKIATYGRTDSTVDSQISALASTKADVLYMGVVIPPLMISGIKHAGTLGWSPEIYMVNNTADISGILKLGKLTGLDDLYTASFVKAADDPQWQDDPGVKGYLESIKEYPKAFGNLVNGEISYGEAETLVATLEQTKAPTRQALMDAVRTLAHAPAVDVLMPGVTLDATDATAPPVHGQVVQHFDGTSWQTVEEKAE